ncbi:type II toxin-antitoxin system Phd/YefM family antitoxin [Cupriavidus sp. EM10]|uniref:type II toxin-antitoxin system Phd/YefM family antitoxin n=1 Tax=Cupriavidus sp. EM10 TaxID=2839983 RepID=UPI001C0006D0|nr:type II toxin-antitoxin system Phd/YefM family antitoxin [Cupriavidus sp. EM10]QWE98144.1 type II toxin-antitoxin system Phd/YefM family antitoxin [Cupriavidus sp. EM10]
MKAMTLSAVRADFEKTMVSVCKENETIVIKRRRGAPVVLMSFQAYESIQETLHLLGTEKNATRLREAIAEFRAGQLRHEVTRQHP